MLHTELRKPHTALGSYRRAGKIPAIVYGHGISSVPVLIDKLEFLKLLRTGAEGSLIDVEVGGEAVKAVLQDWQKHPVTQEYLHLDLYRIRMDETMHAKLHLTFTGEAPAVKTGGVLVKNKDFIDIECLPKDLVSHISVDLSHLTQLHASIKVRDLSIPRGIVVLGSPDDVVVTISEMKEEVVDAARAVEMEKEQIEKLKAESEEKKKGEEQEKEMEKEKK